MLRPIFNALRNSKGTIQSLVTISASLIASGAAAVALIILTRVLGPTKFGEFSVGFSLMLILVRLNDWGMTTVMQKFGSQTTNQERFNSLFSFTTKVRLISCLVTASIGLLSYNWIAAQLHFNQPLIILAAFLTVAATGFFEHFQTVLQALHRFTHAAFANALQGFIKLAIALSFLVTTNLNSVWLMILYSMAPIIPFIGFKYFFPSWLSFKLRDTVSLQQEQVNAVAKHAAIAFVAAGIIENIDILFVQRYLNTYETGLLAGISRIALLFSILAYALSTVLNPRVAKYTQAIDRALFLKKSWLLVLASVVGFLLLFPFTHLLINFTIGHEYIEGTSLLSLRRGRFY